MAATTETVTATGIPSKHNVLFGSWTTDATKGDHVITTPCHVAFVFAILDSGGTNPNMLVKFAAESDESYLLDGGPTQALATSPADSAGITITNNADGTSTIDIDSTSQVNSGTNQWFAITK